MSKQPINKAAQRPNKQILSRTLILLIVCGIVAFIVLVFRLYKVQIMDHEHYEYYAVEQQTRESIVTASRGTIYDRNGKVLAISATVETIFISPREMEIYDEDPEPIARGLAEILEVDYDSIIEKSKDTAVWYKTIKKKVEIETANKVREFIKENNYKSVHIETDSKRYYPYSSLASHIIGFVGDENTGLEGLEAIYDDYLTGTNGRIVRLKNANGIDMLFADYENYYDAVNGDDVSLTIDVTIQHYVEKYLSQAVIDYELENGAGCIVMRPKTGEILAMASMGDFDLNHYLEVSDDVQYQLDQIEDEQLRSEEYQNALFSQWRNKTVADTYEPGSVFKTITLAMALEEGLVSLDDSFYCGGTIGVLGRSPVRCWRDGGHGSQTLTQAMQHSCNCALVEIGLEVGAEKFYEYIDAFGFFEKTGVDLTGEASPQWWSESVFCNKDNLSQLAAASFGQTFNITPIQMVTAISSVVNGGNLMEPYVVKEVRDKDGNIVTAHEPTVVRQVVSEETSRTVCNILEAVVGGSEGTGKNAYVPGYRVGGKTGTTVKTSKEVETGIKEYVVSFCGVAPVDDPELVVLVMLDNPATESVYISGGTMAAPIVGNIIADALPYLGIEPIYSEEELDNIDLTVPGVVGDNVQDAQSRLEKQGFTVRVVGDSETVTDQLPASGAIVISGTEVIVYADEERPTMMVTVPDLSYMSYGDARATLSGAGLYVKTIGAPQSLSSISVSKQSIAPGEQVEFGSVVEITLVDSSNIGTY